MKDLGLKEKGRLKIEWAERFMPVLTQIRERFEKEKPLTGVRVGACLHVTTETANLMIALKAGGAEISLCASNPLSTQDEVAASLVGDFEIPVFAIKGESNEVYYRHIELVLATQPMITMDDGADLISTLHKKYPDRARNVIGGTEETTTGVIRLKSMARERVLLYPIIAVNDALTKHLFDNRYGTGQSTLDGIMRATNFLFAGSVVVICGYGWCGKGLAKRAQGLGAKVIICEVDPLKALEATMDGYQVMPLEEAAIQGDVFITATGNINVISKKHFEVMKNGAILANTGHFNVEIDIDSLKELSVSFRKVRDYVGEFKMNDGRVLYLLGEGRLINLAAAEGHPAMVMDMSFANQALSVEYLFREGEKLEKKVYSVPEEIDRQIASLKLQSMGISIDNLTPEQKKYLSSWEEGT